MQFLETERLLFRSHQLEDLEVFCSMNMDPEVRRYVGGKPWSREKAEARFFGKYIREPSNTFGLWATIHKEDDRYIGYCGLSARYDAWGKLEENCSGLAFYLDRCYWRMGLATEAATAFAKNV